MTTQQRERAHDQWHEAFLECCRLRLAYSALFFMRRA